MVSDTGGGRRPRNRYPVFRRKNRARRGDASSGPRNEATSEEMRAARASGRTPGISTAVEPAAVPLGTDDEAAGTPARAADFAIEIERATSGSGMLGLTASEAMSGRPGHPRASLLAFGRLVTIGAAIVTLVALALVIF